MRLRRSVTALLAMATLAAFVGLPVNTAQADSTTQTYIVQLAHGVSADAMGLKVMGPKAKIVHKVFQGGIVRLTGAQAQALAANPYVASVHPDVRVTSAATETNAPWDLDMLDSPTGALDTSYKAPNDGSGVSVYVLDSGIYRTHNEFATAKVSAGVNFVTNADPTRTCDANKPEDDTVDPTNTGDQNGHGTAVSSLVVGGAVGASKGATLVPVRVLDCDGAGLLSNILRATDWVASNRAPGVPAVVNLSFGISAALMGTDTSLDTALQSLMSSGITVVAAAGNNGGDACQEDPARVPDVLTVAAVTKTRSETSWSNYGSCVDLYGPGDAVVAAGLDVPGTTQGTSYYKESGTSFSAPLVAAAAAQSLHDFPTWTPAQVRADIMGRADAGVVTGPAGGAARSPNELLNVSTQFTGTAPTISGARFAGQTLRAILHWTPTATSTTYQWLRNGTPILNATSSSYVVATTDVGASIAVSVKVSRPRLVDVVGTSQPVVPAAAPHPGMVVTMSPVRLMDTRTSLGATGPIGNGQVVKLPIAGVADMMSSVCAVLVNITVTDATSAGYVTAYASGGAVPPTSNANFTAGSTSANLALVPVGSDGAIALAVAATSAQLVVDVQSYIAGGTPATGDGGAVVPVTPDRLVDTRNAAAVGPWQGLKVQVAGVKGVPSDATAVFVNVTVTQPQASGYLTAYPFGESVPATSNVNFVGGQTIPNLALVKVGSGGSISILNANPGNAQIVVDIQGYVTAGTPSAPGALVPVSPIRVVDTRRGLPVTGPVGAWGTVVVPIDGGSATPAPPHGMVMNLTVTEPHASGWVSAYPTQSSPPLVSNVNYVAAQTVPNLSTVALASSKATLLNGSSGTVQLVADIFGYIL